MSEPDPFYLQGDRTIICPDCGHGIDPHGFDPGGPCGVGDAEGNLCQCFMSPNGIAVALLAVRVVETAEQADALPDRTIIRTRYGTAAQRNDVAWEFPNEVGLYLGEAIDFPATVLWQPEVDRA